MAYLRYMYGIEKTKRKELRLKESALKCAIAKAKALNRSFNNYIETLILEDCKK
jgi:hypothetical protein